MMAAVLVLRQLPRLAVERETALADPIAEAPDRLPEAAGLGRILLDRVEAEGEVGAVRCAEILERPPWVRMPASVPRRLASTARRTSSSPMCPAVSSRADMPKILPVSRAGAIYASLGRPRSIEGTGVRPFLLLLGALSVACPARRGRRSPAAPADSPAGHRRPHLCPDRSEQDQLGPGRARDRHGADHRRHPRSREQAALHVPLHRRGGSPSASRCAPPRRHAGARRDLALPPLTPGRPAFQGECPR